MAAEEPMETTDSTVEGSAWGKDAWMAATEGEMMESKRDMMAKAMIPTRTPRFRLVNIPVSLDLDAHGSGSTVAASLSMSAAPFLVDGG